MKNTSWFVLIHGWIIMASFLLTNTTMAADCGRDAGGKLCTGNLCCSEWGWCGTGSSWCGAGCQSGPCWGTPTPTPPTPTPSPPPPSTPTPPSPPSPSGGVGSIISSTLFEQILKHRNHDDCPARNFYTYNAFITASNSFSGFGTTGDLTIRKREIAAFLAQTSHETTGGWATAPDGPYSWGYCFKEEKDATDDYCRSNSNWPCAPGKKYYGRGPIQISYNYNYGPAGTAIGVDLLNNPDLVATDPTISFKTALWFWMTPQPPKPSSHDVITGRWTPSSADISAGRLPGYGVITNIINGGWSVDMGQTTGLLIGSDFTRGTVIYLGSPMAIILTVVIRGLLDSKYCTSNLCDEINAPTPTKYMNKWWP